MLRSTISMRSMQTAFALAQGGDGHRDQVALAALSDLIEPRAAMPRPAAH
jgi:hypothetical protein